MPQARRIWAMIRCGHTSCFGRLRAWGSAAWAFCASKGRLWYMLYCIIIINVHRYCSTSLQYCSTGGTPCLAKYWAHWISSELTGYPMSSLVSWLTGCNIYSCRTPAWAWLRNWLRDALSSPCRAPWDEILLLMFSIGRHRAAAWHVEFVHECTSVLCFPMYQLSLKLGAAENGVHKTVTSYVVVLPVVYQKLPTNFESHAELS